MKSLLDQLRTFWSGLDGPKRLSLVLGVLITLGALVALQMWAFRTRYETVLTSRDAAEIRAVVEGLDEETIPYRITADGTQIDVPREVAGKARIRAAASGAAPGLEGLDNLKLGVSPRREMWSYQRALQGELVRTLNQLDEVEASRVHLVLPERSAFLAEETPGSASITLRLRPGRSLSESQVRGITSLVAGAVEGLKPSKVVLVDEKGRLLSDPTEPDPEQAEYSRLMELRKSYQDSYRKAIDDALLPVLGSEAAFQASVTADLDPTTVDTTTSTLDPDSQVLISEQIQEQKAGEDKPVGIPGTTSNLPEFGTGTGTAQGQQTSSRSVSNYEYSRVQKRIVQTAGNLKRLSVAVVVDTARVEELATKGNVTAEEIRGRIDQTVKAAMAFDTTRGDTLTVSYLPFLAGADSGEALTEESFDWKAWLPYGVVALVLVALFVFVIRPIMGVLTRTRPPAGELERRLDVAVTSEGLPATEAVTRVSAAEKSDLTRRLRALVEDYKPVEAAELNRLVEAEVEASAQVLRRWLKAG